MLNHPIPATFHGAPVRVYGTTPDGRVLIAHADGKTETTIWESLRVEPEDESDPAQDSEADGWTPTQTTRGYVLPENMGWTLAPRAPQKPAPPEPWGEWVKFNDPNRGETWTRRRNFGTESQYVRYERDGWIWRWGALREGGGFASMDAARLACEAYTARVEGSPAPMPADGAPVPPTFDDAGEE